MDVIVADHVTKAYRAGVGRARIREMLPWPLDAGGRRLFKRWWLRDTFHALQDVSLAVEAGSSVGIIGHNGAGKTTLLRIIAGITSPTSGAIATNGRVAALIDVLVGFHPELTGRENVYLLGAIQGFDRKAMRKRIPQILDFAHIHELIDTPVKRYSAGMGARLGFATLTALDVQVLLVDEVLAVGDASFQRKCIQWLDGYRAHGGTLLFVSHNLGLIKNMTERAVWLDHGSLVSDGDSREVVLEYAKAMEKRDLTLPSKRVGRGTNVMRARGLHRWGAGGARIRAAQVDDDDPSGLVQVLISYESAELDEGAFCVGFLDEGGRELAFTASPLRPIEGSGTVRCVISPIPFRPGIYFPVVGIVSQDGRVRDSWRLDRAIAVNGNGATPTIEDFGPVEVSARWD
jgi:ABC-type polysaccharide/polyol phosphate transport system ATPase subunit